MKSFTLILALLLTLSGCKVKPVADAAQVKPLIGISSAVARADVRVATIAEVAKDFARFAPSDFASFVSAQALAARKELTEANTQVYEATESAGKAQEQLKEANRRIGEQQTLHAIELASERQRTAEAESHWGYVVGHWIDRALFWLSLSLVAAIVMRALSLMLVGNPIGKVFAFASTAIFGVLTLGVSLLQAGADNYYFRKRAPEALVQ